MSRVTCIGNHSDNVQYLFNLNSSLIQYLDIKFFSITNVTEMFHLKKLLVLKLESNSITDVGSKRFGQVENLRKLDLSENCLSHLSSDAFSGLANLIYLDLSRNKLIQIDGVFGELEKLEVLNLHDNYLFNISENTFAELRNLLHLNLHSNLFNVLDATFTFVPLLKLQTLNFSQNCVGQLDKLNVFSYRFSFLDLSSACLKRVPQCLTSSVSHLYLAGNNLTSLFDGDFDSYQHLKYLDLSYNNLKYIEVDSLGRLQTLETLILGDNLLKDIPISLPLRLKMLNLQSNHLSHISHDSFRDSVLLTRLILANNHINNISQCSFCKLKRLNVLNLAKNNISIIHRDLFIDLTSLTTLILADNPIVSLEKYSFISLSKCRALDLSYLQHLDSVDSNILDPLVDLQTLNVSSSFELAKYIVKSSKLVESIHKVVVFDISNNGKVPLSWTAAQEIDKNIRILLKNFTTFECEIYDKELENITNICDITKLQHKTTIQFRSTITNSFPSTTSAPKSSTASTSQATMKTSTTTMSTTTETEHFKSNIELNISNTITKSSLSVDDIEFSNTLSNHSNISAYDVPIMGKAEARNAHHNYTSSPSNSIIIIFSTLLTLVLICAIFLAKKPIGRFISNRVMICSRRSRTNRNVVYESCDDNLSVINLSDAHVVSSSDVRIRPARSDCAHCEDGNSGSLVSYSTLSSCQTHRLLSQKYNEELFVDLT
ncbi:Protein artichoke [Nymphon striatum]|nr:Protein artichoke [Nymphon striatum]